MKQFAPACDRNKDPILDVLQDHFKTPGTVLEVGAGTGQHAVWFAAALPHLIWQPADLVDSHDSINGWRDEAELDNLLPPQELDLSDYDWSNRRYDYVVCINTIHIVSWRNVKALFDGISVCLKPNGRCFLYGPYRYSNRPLEPSNQKFDLWLKDRNPNSGVRDFDEIEKLATHSNLALVADITMPANNRALVWKKSGSQR